MVKVNPEVREAEEFVKGVFAGFGLNWLWEFAQLPGFGVPLFEIARVDEQRVYFGADDAVQAMISAAIAVGGHYAGRPDIRNFGLGMLAGTFATKLGDLRKIVVPRVPPG